VLSTKYGRTQYHVAGCVKTRTPRARATPPPTHTTDQPVFFGRFRDNRSFTCASFPVLLVLPPARRPLAELLRPNRPHRTAARHLLRLGEPRNLAPTRFWRPFFFARARVALVGGHAFTLENRTFRAARARTTRPTPQPGAQNTSPKRAPKRVFARVRLVSWTFKSWPPPRHPHPLLSARSSGRPEMAVFGGAPKRSDAPRPSMGKTVRRTLFLPFWPRKKIPAPARACPRGPVPNAGDRPRFGSGASFCVSKSPSGRSNFSPSPGDPAGQGSKYLSPLPGGSGGPGGAISGLSGSPSAAGRAALPIARILGLGPIPHRKRPPRAFRGPQSPRAPSPAVGKPTCRHAREAVPRGPLGPPPKGRCFARRQRAAGRWRPSAKCMPRFKTLRGARKTRLRRAKPTPGTPVPAVGIARVFFGRVPKHVKKRRFRHAGGCFGVGRPCVCGKPARKTGNGTFCARGAVRATGFQPERAASRCSGGGALAFEPRGTSNGPRSRDKTRPHRFCKCPFWTRKNGLLLLLGAALP
jgi:hypothetical protein